MKVFQFPLAKITICFLVGILIAYYGKPTTSLAFIYLLSTLLFFVIAFIFSKKNKLHTSFFGIATYCLSIGIGITTHTVNNGFLQKDNYVHQIDQHKKTQILEVVLREKLKNTNYSDRYIAIVKKIDHKSCYGKIIVHFYKDQFKNAFQVGNNLQLIGSIINHQEPNNPDQFDYGKYLIHKNIMAQIYVSNSEVKISKIIDKNIYYYADVLRNTILKNLEKSKFNPTELSIVAALILGQQQDISPEILQDYQFAGAIHILSVSGLHVGFILLFLNFLLGFLPVNKWTSLFKITIVLFSLWGFAFLAGLSPSVIRSVTMFSFVAIGLFLKRKTNIFHTLLVSIFLILLFEPSFLFDVGFQLSYVALFFILWLQPMLIGLWNPKNKIIFYFWNILTVSFAAQIGAFPLSVYYFHQFPGLFFVTNLIIIPFLSIIMVLGVVIMIGAIFNYIPELMVKTLEGCIFILNKIIEKIASFEQFIIKDISFNWVMLFTLYLVIFTVFILFEKPSFKRVLTVLVAVILFQLGYFSSRWRCQNQNELIVFNSKKSTLIAERQGEKVMVYSNDLFKNYTALKSYLTANFSTIQTQKKLKNILYYNSKKILIVDSRGLYPKNCQPDILVLCQSPKINLDRLLSTCKPKLIIADASNYKSYNQLWKTTCWKEKIPFHNTVDKGFYRMQ